MIAVPHTGLKVRGAVAFAAAWLLAVGCFATVSLADDNSKGRTTTRSDAGGLRSAGEPAGTVATTRTETIVLPFFSPGVTSPTTAASPQASVIQPTSPIQTSVIQLPAFSAPSSAAKKAPPPPPKKPPPPHRPPPHHKIPEIDSASAANALTLLIGGVLLLTDRRRRVACR